MVFPTVVFGSADIVTIQPIYIHGNSIAYRLYIVPILDIGNNSINIGFTYINQNGTQKTTVIPTTIPANTPVGTYIEVLLESGDIGIQDIIDINVVGGSPGDQLNFQSQAPDPVIVFGTYDATTQIYTDGGDVGGYSLFIVPIIKTGNVPINIGFIYINQNGIQKTTATPTVIPINTPAGTHIQAILNAGDTGIRDLIGINIFTGGCTSDRLSFKSRTTDPVITFGTIGDIDPLITYTTGDSIPSGGLRLFIVPKINLGNAPVDIGFTYINQFGELKTTSVSTSVAANTTAGTRTQVILEGQDTGIRSLVAIDEFVGGCTGDRLSFESYNEGIGRYPISVASTKSFDRTEIYPETTPEYPEGIPAHIFEPYIGLWKGKSYSTLYDTSGNPSSLVPIMYYSDPQIPIPITFNKSAITEWIPEPLTGRVPITKIINLADEIGARKEIVSWIPEPLTGNDYNGKIFFVFKSWIESVVGQVLSGYVQNVSGDVIKNAFSMILISPPTDTNPSGITATADVNPDNGLYQAFLKKVIYDKRYIIVKLGIKNIALEGAGIPEVIDGNQQLPIPYNLQFACPIKNCDFTVTRKIT